MLVSCPKCTSRYQLGDDKIKSTGTKVRCPRCQNTFKVFPTPPEDEVSEDRTELFMRREGGLEPKREEEKTVTRREKEESAASRAHTEINPQNKAAAAHETQRSTKPRKEPSPFKKKYSETEISDASSEISEEIAESHSDFPGFNTPNEEVTKPPRSPDKPFRDPARHEKKEPVDSPQSEEEKHESPEVTPTPRPFGDATFLAIQKMGSGKQGKRRALVAFSLILIVVAGFFLLTRSPGDGSRNEMAIISSKSEEVRFNRPSKWYDDEPQIFQRFLSQMATLPQAEQIQSKNRALIAEALVLNGSLTGNYDQVAQGVGFASSLLISTPGDVYGFYALSTNAWLKDDLSTLGDLINRWPAGNRSDLEFKLGSMLIGARTDQKIAAIELGKGLLQEFPESSRVATFVLATAAESWPDAHRILGEKTLQDLVKGFNRKKDAIEKGGVNSPDFYSNLERKLQRKGLLNQIAERPKATPKPTPPPTEEKKTEESVTQRLNQKAAEKLQSKKPTETPKVEKPVAAPPTPAPAPAPAPESNVAAPGSSTPSTPPPAPKQSTRLPKPSEQLMAQNKQEVREESEAAKLYRQGNSFLQANKPDEAVLAFQKSLRFDPDFADSYKKLGEIYMKKQDKERALRSFKIYLQLKPDSSDKQVVEGWISSLQ